MKIAVPLTRFDNSLCAVTEAISCRIPEIGIPGHPRLKGARTELPVPVQEEREGTMGSNRLM
jgi:hypothetical protein